MAHRRIETYRQIAARERAIMSMRCTICDVPLRHHDEKFAGHKFETRETTDAD